MFKKDGKTNKTYPFFPEVGVDFVFLCYYFIVLIERQRKHETAFGSFGQRKREPVVWAEMSGLVRSFGRGRRPPNREEGRWISLSMLDGFMEIDGPKTWRLSSPNKFGRFLHVGSYLCPRSSWYSMGSFCRATFWSKGQHPKKGRTFCMEMKRNFVITLGRPWLGKAYHERRAWGV